MENSENSGGMFKDMTPGGKKVVQALIFILIVGALAGGFYGYTVLFPKKAKVTKVTTDVTGLPPLAYDKGANAPFRKLPQFNEPADVQSPMITGGVMGWNALAGVNYSVGGLTTSVGSICEELGLNVRLSVQNACNEQGNGLYAFAESLHNGNAQPTVGYHFINWMADANGQYLAGLNARLIKDFGEESRAEVLTFTGASLGEDKWLIKPKFLKDPRGSLTITVIRDGDWNTLYAKCQLNKWEVNNEPGTYDAHKVNVVDAPNGDYTKAGEQYLAGAKYTLHIVENGKLAGRDTTIGLSGISSWFPVDMAVVQGKGGLVTIASTKEFSSQMGCGLIFIKAWADENKELVDKLVEAFGRGGDQVKSHDAALQFASQVSEVVFADKTKTAEDWYKAFKSFPLSDEDGNEVQIGGSRVFNIADAANYVGIAGGNDKYKIVYNKFGNLAKETYPELVPSFPDYESVVDWSYLSRVYGKTKSAGTAGSISKTDFNTATKGGIVGDANYSIQFNTGSSDIKPASYAELNKVLALLTTADNTFVEVAGHTDNVGDPTSNQQLSQERADAVKAYFISQNSDFGAVGKIKARGFGQDAPLNPDANQNSVAERTANRRVQIKVYKAK